MQRRTERSEKRRRRTASAPCPSHGRYRGGVPRIEIRCMPRDTCLETQCPSRETTPAGPRQDSGRVSSINDSVSRAALPGGSVPGEDCHGSGTPGERKNEECLRDVDSNMGSHTTS